MKKSLTLIIILGCSSLNYVAFAAGEKEVATKDEQAVATEVPKWYTDFSNLPEAKRTEFIERCNNASRLFNEKRIFECMMDLEKAEEIYKSHPQQLNLMGACYVEFRNFEKARQYFKRALEVSPGDLSVLFNLGEVEFVSHSWKAAVERFEHIIEELTKNPKAENSQNLRLSQFKALVAKTKMKDKAGADKLAALYTDESDTPFYYMANAVNLFEEGNKEEAGRQVYIARAIYGDTKGAEVTAYEDTMVEAGYLNSFYGGGNEKGNKNSTLPEDQ